MANLLTLGAIPELFHEILEYLEQGDTFSLLLTCRTLYPNAYKRLWKTIRLYNKPRTAYSNPSVYVDPYLNQLLPYAVPLEKGFLCYKLMSIFNTLGPQNTGLALTRKLELHETSLHGTNGFLKSSLIHHVEAFLASGGLNLNCIELHFNINVNSDKEKEAISWFLTHLKEYSKSKQPDEFSIILTSPLDVVMARMIDVEKVTILNLNINWRNSSGNAYTPDDMNVPDDEYDSDSYEDLEPQSDHSDDERNSVGGSRYRDYDRETFHRDITQWNYQLADRLTALLSRCISLTSLTLRSVLEFDDTRFVDFKLSKPLHDLQTAFNSLPKLRILKFRHTFFHPSYFIPPPESTTVVSYAGLLSNSWFQSFKKYPFTNVKDLSINITKDTANKRLWCRNDFKVRPLGDIAISGLTKCDITDEMDTAPDLAKCILIKNKNLDKSSKQQILGGIAQKLQQVAENRLISAATQSLTSINDTEANNPFLGNPPSYIPHHETAITTAGNRCLSMLPNAVDKVEAWEYTRRSATIFAGQCEAWINSLLSRFKTMLMMEYSQKLLNGEEEEHPDDVANASKECLKRMLDNFDNHDWWEEASARSHVYMNTSKQRVDNQIKEFTEKQAKEYVFAWAESGELDNLDIGMMSEKLTQECAQKLSKMGLKKPNPQQSHGYFQTAQIPMPPYPKYWG
ncbi:hypothetical protein TWF281_008763 [Arthrobotrys megalospora]